MRNSGLNSADLKSLNRGLILKLMITEQKHTRIELSKETGLTKMTLSNIINEFIEQQYVGEKKLDKNNNVGRNPIFIDILPTAPKIIGVNISRGFVEAVLCDLKLNIIKKAAKPLLNEDCNTLKDKLCSVINSVKTKNIIGIGVSAIGPLDADKGVILNPTEFFGITDFAIGDFLKNRFELPVYLNNDMKSAALCEKMFGSGRGLDDFLYVGISNGVGSGIITQGKLYQHGGLSGEIGHVSIDYNGIPCSCGNNGCLETYISVPKLTKELENAVGVSLSFEDFCEKMPQKSEPVFEKAIQKLAFALVGQVNMLNPKAVIIGHEGAWLNKKYMASLQDKINKGKLSKQHGSVEVIAAKYGVEAPLYGSACCVLDEIFKGGLI